MTPVSTLNITPPLTVIIQWNRLRRGRENHRTSHQVFRWRRGKLFFRRRNLRHGHVARGINEFCKLLVSHVGFIHPESVYINPVDGLGIVYGVHRGRGAATGRWQLTSHPEFTTRYPDHPIALAIGYGPFVG